MSHTPGTWKWRPDLGNFIVTKEGYPVAEIKCTTGNPGDGFLIAAAPELLEALKETTDYIKALVADKGTPNEVELLNKGKQAIAKAERG